MKAIIAEKPSVAREIAILVGATERKDGFLIGGGYCVTWALGHLVGLAMPEDYGLAGFQKDSLPILPDPFLLTVRKVKKNKSYTADPGALKQLKVIERVFKDCDSIIVATDAGREGELIFRYIYEYLKCKKPFQRLWISSLTEKAIRAGMDSLKPGSDFDTLYLAAKSRSRADWLVGINASQGLSIAAGEGTYSLGRVQTPALALICKRYLDNCGFQSVNYWQLQLEHRKEFIDFKSLSKDRWDDKKLAESAFKSIQRSGAATVSTVELKNVTEQPPLLFDLTGLQKEANQKLSFTADETLTIAQGLYEKRFISYPRTGSKYIPEDVWAEIPSLIKALEERASFRAAISQLKLGRLNKRVVNDLKVTDHHGLLITEKIPSALSAKENAIYDMIAFRMLEAVSQQGTKQITDISLQVLHYEFLVKTTKILEPGWRGIQGSYTTDENSVLLEMPTLAVGDELKIKNAEIQDKKTRPPGLYSEAELLSAMENAGKTISCEEERKALQDIGIGTPATRAAIIEALFDRSYIKREKKLLLPTEKGIKVFHMVKDKKIADVSMTAQWELALQDIEEKGCDAHAFQKEIEVFVKSITAELLEASPTTEDIPSLDCPKCKNHKLVFRDILVKCPDKNCNWVQYRNVCGVRIPIAELENLVVNGRTSLIKGMVSKSGKSFDACIILNQDSVTSFEFSGSKTK